MSGRHTLSLATATVMGASLVSLGVGVSPAAAADCTTTYYSGTNLTGTSDTRTPGQEQTLSFDAKSATVDASCKYSVDYKTAQGVVNATITPGGSNLAFDASIRMAMIPNHNEVVLTS